MAGLARLALAGEVPAPQLPPGSLGLLRQLPLGVKPSWPPSSSSLRCPRSAIETILRVHVLEGVGPWRQTSSRGCDAGLDAGALWERILSYAI